MLTAPLHKLKNEKNLAAVWTDAHTRVLRNLQMALVNAPVISVPNTKYPYCVVTDSSAFGIAGVLYQVINNNIKYLGFMARSLSPSERNYGSSQRELLAVIYTFEKFKQWLMGRHFHLFTDNMALLYLHSQLRWGQECS